MSRPLKFRAWDKHTREMFTPNRIDLTDEGSVRAYFNKNGHYNSNMELMQFTGLHDKNGKWIWEGDLIITRGDSWTGFLYEVAFGNGEFYAFSREKSLMPDIHFRGLQCQVEVLGNIYENPELLK